MNLENLKKVLDKLGTLLVDRRMWVVVLYIVGRILGVEEFITRSDELGGQVAETIKALIDQAGFLVALVALLISYAIRPPSGPDGTPNVASTVSKSVNKAVKEAVAESLKK